MFINRTKDGEAALRRAITGWSGHGWKDGRYVDDIEEYFDKVREEIKALEAEKEKEDYENYIFQG